MKKEFLKVARRGHFFEHHKKVLVAVSGGKDSMALLECLLSTKDFFMLDIGIAHINHKQRKESDEEEEYLRNFAKNNKIPIHVATYSYPNFSEKKARDFRYEFFKKVMEKYAYTALVTAHHADDQAETVFMRLLRGSRLKHLSGIQAVQNFGPGQLIRPLLSFKKSELEASFYFEDASNHENQYLRNRIRNSYLPILEKENPNFSNFLTEFAQENAGLFQAFKDLTKHLNIQDMAVFTQQTPSVQYFLLQDYLSNFPELQISRAQFDEMLTILRTKANYQHHLKNDYFLIKDDQFFEISKILPKTDEKNQQFVIKSAGVFEFGDFIFSLRHQLEKPDHILMVEKNAPILLRYRIPGDSIYINGIHKKLRRYFIDHKIPQKKRHQAVLIEQNQKILGVANLVTSDLSKSLKNGIMSDKLYIKMKER